LIGFGAGVLATTGVGILATKLIRSPQEALADTAAPSRGLLTAPVELRVLTDTVVLRGTVTAGSSLEVTPVPAEGRPVVTRMRVGTGQEFAAGSVLIEVAGRPLIALAGPIPAYRDLRPGMSGDDVAQLQKSLRQLGHGPQRADGVFGTGTKTALTNLYNELGYEVATTGDGDDAAVTAAQQQVTVARRALDEANEALARVQQNPPTPAPGEPDPVRQAQKQVRFAREDLDSARKALAELLRTTGPMLPLSEYAFLPSFPGRVEKSTATVGVDVVAPLLTLSSGALLVRADLNPGQRALIKDGMAVKILSELNNITAEGVVSSIGELAQDQNGGRTHPMVVVPTGTLDRKLAGADVRLTVQAAATEGEVLVVPISAVYADADGTASVLKVNPDGSQTRVQVTPGVSGDGYVAVVSDGGSLASGDIVVVGAASDGSAIGAPE
jgi:HlyD family secretion protein